MGLFGSRKKTTVGTSVMRVMEDNTLPNSIITGSIMAIQEADGQMIEHSIEELSNGLGIRVDRLYRYAKKHYINGLPSSSSMTNLIGKDTIAKAIAADIGKEIGLDYYHVGALNMLHLGWFLLCRDHDYDSRDNSLMYNGKRVYLTDMQPIVVDATKDEIDSGSLDMWGASPASGKTPLRPIPGVDGDDSDRPAYIVEATATQDFIRVKVCHEVVGTKVIEGVSVPSTTVESGEFQLSLAGWNMEASYHQASYTVDTRKGYWLYELESNADPEIEAIFDTAPSENGTFFPMTYFRFDKQAITKDSPEYETTDKMLYQINMKFDDVADAINENPDVADVEQAIMMFAVPADATSEVEQRYLFDFFNNLWMADEFEDKTTKAHNQALLDLRAKLHIPMPKSSIIIQDKKFKMTVNWDAIVKRRVAGKVTKKGHYTSSIGKKTDKVVKIEVLGKPMELQVGKPLYIYQHQITEDVYEEIEVVGIQTTYHIWGKYTTTGDENNNDILLIPLDYAISKEYTIKDREELYARSMHYVFNSRVTIKLKWYQTGVFRVIMIIVAVVITILSKGATWKLIAAAWAAGGVVAVLYVLIPILIKYVLISLIIRKVVSIIGVKAAFIIAVIAAVAGAYGAMAEGGVANAPWAADLMNLSTNLTSAMGKELKSEYNDLMGEYRDFEEYTKDKQEQLKSVNNALDGNTHLVPMVIWGETPNDFYQRTVHSGNIGIVGIEAVSSYVDAALTLPTISDTLGGFYV